MSESMFVACVLFLMGIAAMYFLGGMLHGISDAFKRRAEHEHFCRGVTNCRCKR